MRPLFLLLAVAICAMPVQARDGDSAVQTVLKAIHALDTALVAKDVPALGALLEPEFVGTVPSGVALAKDAYIAFHTRPQEGLVSIDTAAGTEPKVRVFDDVFAVVNRRVAVRRADAAGQVEGFEVQRIEVLRRTDGRWQMVSGQGTRVQH